MIPLQLTTIFAFLAGASEDPYMTHPLAQEKITERTEEDHDVQVRQQISVPDESFLYLYLPD